MKSSHAVALSILILLLTSCSFSLAGDVTPPPGYEEQQQQLVETTPEPVSGPLYPTNPPDLENGQAIYAEKCAPCHGPTGQGDGPQAAQLPNPPTALGDPEVARQASPAQWYTAVTQGNFQKLMPPFRSLSDQQRWDVVAFAFSLSQPPEATGESSRSAKLYAEKCARCHGEDGGGDGPDAAGLSTPPTDFSDAEGMAQKSAAFLFQAITEGVPPDMPAYADEISEEERWALANHLYSLAFNAPGTLAQGTALATPIAQAPTQAANATPSAASATEIAATETVSSTTTMTSTTGTITGKVINASNGPLPSDLVVKLHGFDSVQAVITETTDIESDGAFAFQNIEMPVGRAFVVVVELDGASYASDVAVIEPNVRNLDLPVTVYETTTDASTLSISRMHLFFEFSGDDTIRVYEVYVLGNQGDKTVIGAGEGEPVIKFKLPEGASNLQFQDGSTGERFSITEDGFNDTAPIQPGAEASQVVVAFDMPYQRRLELIQPVPLPVDSVIVLAPENGTKVRGEALSDNGVRDVGGTTYHLYSSSSLDAGQDFRLSISGRPGGKSGLALGSVNSVVIGLIGLGVTLVIAGLVLYRRNRENGDEERAGAAPVDERDLAQETPDSLMDAILALDDLYAAGQLPEEAYLLRRAELKNRLKELMAP